MARIPTVAKRNDPTAFEPYAKSESTRADNLPAGWVGHWFRADQLESKCKPHEYPETDFGVGFLKVAGWQVVHKDEGVITGRGPAAGSNNTDTTVTKGDLTLCKLPEAEYAKYGHMQRLIDARVTQRFAGEHHDFGMQTSFKTRTVGGSQGLEASTSDILESA